MKIREKVLLKSVYFSGICTLSFIITGCFGSDNPATPSAVEAGIYGVTVVEDADDLEFVVSLSAASTETVSVEYATTNGTALAGIDYSAISGTLQFAPGERRKFVTVTVLDNNAAATVTS